MAAPILSNLRTHLPSLSTVCPAVCQKAKNIVGKTFEVAKGVFLSTAPHLLNTSHFLWPLSRMSSCRILAWPAIILFELARVQWLNSDVNEILSIFLPISAEIFDLLGLVPNQLEMRFLFDLSILMYSTFKSAALFKRGIEQFRGEQPTDTTQWIQKSLTGFTLSSFAFIRILSNVEVAGKLFSGYIKAASLGSNTLKFVLKHRLIQEIGTEKTCHAVWLESSGNTVYERMPDPVAEAAFKTCSMFIDYPKSDQDVCSALQKAAADFGKPIKHLFLSSHGDFQKMYFAPGYIFKSNTAPIACIDHHLAHDADLFLLGCSTGSSQNGKPSLAEEISYELAGRTVIGIDALIKKVFLSVSYERGKFSLKVFDDLWDFLSSRNKAISFTTTPPQ